MELLWTLVLLPTTSHSFFPSLLAKCSLDLLKKLLFLGDKSCVSLVVHIVGTLCWVLNIISSWVSKVELWLATSTWLSTEVVSDSF